MDMHPNPDRTIRRGEALLATLAGFDPEFARVLEDDRSQQQLTLLRSSDELPLTREENIIGHVCGGSPLMSQITLYLDDQTDAALTQAAKRSGLSKSRWVADLIRRHAGDAWPVECRELAGAFPDFPLCEPGATTHPAPDVPRVGF